MLTKPVTRMLPEGWQGAFSEERARQWIIERNNEGTTLLVVSRSAGEPVGLMILYESIGRSTAAVELRLGYILAEEVWGEGLASELVGGFVSWCKVNNVASIAGGVARANVASRRVLEKNGFVCDPNSRNIGSGEQLFRLQLEPRGIR